MPGFFEQQAQIVVFNLNTTGLSGNAHLMQISAMHYEKIYNAYILPQRPIENGAAAVNGFVCSDGRLYVKGIEKVPKDLYTALKDFIKFLARCSRGRVVLVAHCAHNFHADRLMRVIKRVGLVTDFKKVVVGFSDTLPLFQEICPANISLTLPDLNNYYQTGFVSLHNSVTKCQALDKVMGAVGVTYDMILDKLLQLEDLI